MEWELSKEFRTVTLARYAHAAKVTLNRPDVMNSWDERLPLDLMSALRVVEGCPDIRAVMIVGAGRAFSAGADLNMLADGHRDGSLDIGRQLRQASNPVVLALRRLAKPVVAAVNVPAAGIGMSVALASDLVLAAGSATFTPGFLRLRLAPQG